MTSTTVASNVSLTLDTNILIYAIDGSAGAKHTLAARLLLRAAAAGHPLMLQSLNEFCAVARKKRLLPASSLVRAVQLQQEAFTFVPPSAQDLIDAIHAQDDHQIQFWDALLWATARRAGCTVILSEDFQHSRTLGGVQILNPFLLSARDLKKLLP